MGGLINNNGQLVESQVPIIGFDNRAFSYGDGVFETVFVDRCQLPLWPYHSQRLLSAIGLYGLELRLDVNELLPQIRELIEANGLAWKRARVKLVVYREGAGLYAPGDSLAKYAIGAKELDGKGILEWGSKGLQLGTAKKVCLPSWGQGVKSLSAIDYVQAARECQYLGFDNVLLCNEKTEICEAVGSNVWWYKDGKTYTPSLKTGCVEGVFRRFLLQKLRATGYACEEVCLALHDLEGVEAMWLTNAVRGIQWVANFGGEPLQSDRPLVIHELVKDWLFS